MSHLILILEGLMTTFAVAQVRPACLGYTGE